MHKVSGDPGSVQGIWPEDEQQSLQSLFTQELRATNIEQAGELFVVKRKTYSFVSI